MKAIETSIYILKQHLIAKKERMGKILTGKEPPTSRIHQSKTVLTWRQWGRFVSGTKKNVIECRAPLEAGGTHTIEYENYFGNTK